LLADRSRKIHGPARPGHVRLGGLHGCARSAPIRPVGHLPPQAGEGKQRCSPWCRKSGPPGSAATQASLPQISLPAEARLPSSTSGEHPDLPFPASGDHSHLPSPASGDHSPLPSPASGDHSHLPSPASGDHSYLPSPASGDHSYLPSPASGDHSYFPSPASGGRCPTGGWGRSCLERKTSGLQIATPLQSVRPTTGTSKGRACGRRPRPSLRLLPMRCA
jgi:hypothetical protein